MTKISFGCTRDFRVKMWGTSLREDKLADDLGNAIEATSIVGSSVGFFTARKLAPGNLGLLQQYRHFSDLGRCQKMSDLSPLSGPKRTLIRSRTLTRTMTKLERR